MKLHPLGPVPVVAFLIDGEGPHSFDDLIEANTAPGIYCDPGTIESFKLMAPGESFAVPIGGGWTEVRAVVAEEVQS